MTVEKIKAGDVLKAIICGRVDTSTAPQLEAEVKDDLDSVTKLILDLNGLDYISSAGLRVLLTMQKIMNEQGSMRVVGVNETVYEIFEVTGFTDILTIERAE